MQKNDQDWKEMVYDLMNGYRNLESYPLKESQWIQNEFAEGHFCAKAYETVFRANQKICQKLGVSEDEDIEQMITKLLEITKYLCMKMYDYGMFFSSPSSKY